MAPPILQTLPTSPTGASCPSAEDLTQLLMGTLAADSWESLSRHVETCESCAVRMRSLAAPEDDLVAALRQLRGSELRERDAALEREMAAIATGGMPETSAAIREELPLLPLGTHLREYRLEEKIGEGGMGTVFRVVHTRLDKVMALKVLNPGRMNNQDAAARFQREMKAVGKLSHPHVVQATDAGEAHGTQFLVMEYVEGTNLARLVQRRGPVPVADACELIRQAALGLAEIHAQGLVHRDIKPSNLIVTGAGVVKILDLGLALLRETPRAGDGTSSDVVLGSWDYMAPEQGDDPHAVTPAADLYSLGCTLYHLLTGQPPFPMPTYANPLQKLKAHAMTTAPSVRTLRPEVPAGLANIVDRLLAKDPGRRPSGAAEVAGALAPFARASNLARLVGAEDSVTEQAPRDHRTNRPVLPQNSRRPKRFLWAAALLALIVAAAVVIVIQTDAGTLEIRSDDKEVKVIVERGGELITVIDLRTDKKITLKSGKYQLKLGDGPKDLELSTNEMTLRRGDKEVVSIRRLPKTVDPAKNVAAPTTERILKGHTGWVYTLAYSPNGRWLASGSNDQTIRVWDARTGKLQHLLSTTEPVFCLAFAPDNKTLASASHRGTGTVLLWDVEKAKQVDVIQLHGGGIWDVGFSPAGDLLASAGADKTSALWDRKTAQRRHRLTGGKDRIRRVLFLDDGKTLIAAGSALTFWDVQSGKEKFSIPHLQTSSIKVSPDGRTLAAAHWGNRTISLFDIATAKLVRSWTAHDAYLNDLAFSPNGKVLASAGHDGLVRLWKTKDQTSITILRGHTGPVDPVAFAPDGKTLASGGVNDFNVRLWNVAPFGCAAGE